MSIEVQDRFGLLPDAFLGRRRSIGGLLPVSHPLGHGAGLSPGSACE
jgi:hypothetical protein